MERIRHAEAIRVGGTYEVEAIRLNDDGDGVAIVNGLTVFIPNLLISECATVDIVSFHRRFARGRVVKRHNDSPNRVVSISPVLEESGSCPLLHLEYSEQLRHKEQIVSHALRNITQSVKPTFQPMIGMDNPFRYRNQVQVPMEWDNHAKRIRYGFFAKDSHTIIDSPTSILETVTMEQTISMVVEFLNSLGQKVCELVHHIIIRESYTSNQQMVILSITHKSSILRERLAEFFSTHRKDNSSAEIVTVGLTIQPNRTGPVWGQHVEVVAGIDTIWETLVGLDFLISPRSFFQVNTVQANRLYETVRRFANLTGTERVLDAYCGTGTIALALSRFCESVLGIEMIAAAIHDANQNAAYNHIENAEFIVGEVEITLPRLIEQGQQFDVIVLDPPRKGAHPDVIAAVHNAKPQKVIYVSCNPATLSRDASLLASCGYCLETVQPVDMFPQTSHVESVCLFIKN